MEKAHNLESARFDIDSFERKSYLSFKSVNHLRK